MEGLIAYSPQFDKVEQVTGRITKALKELISLKWQLFSVNEITKIQCFSDSNDAKSTPGKLQFLPSQGVYATEIHHPLSSIFYPLSSVFLG